MTKEEKRFMKKLLETYRFTDKNVRAFTREENMIIERWLVHGLLNPAAFANVTAHGDNYRNFIPNLGHYPFTTLGDEERSKSWYLEFRNRPIVILLRDGFTVFAFIVTLMLTLAELFSK
jgi:hypothetical protein